MYINDVRISPNTAAHLVELMKNIGHNSFYLADYNEQYGNCQAGTLTALHKFGLVENTGNVRVSPYTITDYRYVSGRYVTVELTISSEAKEWRITDKAWELIGTLVTYVEVCKHLNENIKRID